MTHSIPPAGLRRPVGERLPWLDDAPQRRSGRRTSRTAGWVAALMFGVAGASYWAGLRSLAPGEPATSEISASLPQVRAGIEGTAGTTAATPPGEGSPLPSDALLERVSERATDDQPKAAAKKAVERTQPQSPTAGDRYPLWPSGKLEGAEGRLVRIGFFDTATGAHEGWKKILAEYPGMARLSPVVVSNKSLRDGRMVYSLQLGTSSQAHSDVVCERSNGLALNCSVVGLVVTDN